MSIACSSSDTLTSHSYFVCQIKRSAFFQNKTGFFHAVWWIWRAWQLVLLVNKKDLTLSIRSCICRDPFSNAVRLTALSHQPYLVRLNWTWVCFAHVVRFVGAGVNAAAVLRCAPEVDQTSGPRPGWRGGLCTLPNEPWCSSFLVRMWSDLGPS